MSDPVDYYVAAILLSIKHLNPEKMYDSEQVLTETELRQLWQANTLLEKYDLLRLDKYYKSALDVLCRSKYFSMHSESFGDDIFKINSSISIVEEYLDLGNQPLQNAIDLGERGDGWLKNCLSQIIDRDRESADPATGVEILENFSAWQPLPLERESDEFKAAVEIIENAIETIEGDNGYAANEPEERAAILTSLKSGYDALIMSSPTAMYLDYTLAKPLKYIAKKFGDTIIGTAAKKAAEVLFSYFGIG